jgi:hypothetical protein
MPEALHRKEASKVKRARFIIAAAAVLAIAIPSGAVATHSPNDGPKHDFAVGGGISALPFATRFGFAAQDTPNGDTHGHATFNTDFPTTLNRQGDVICLNVNGKQAVFEIRDSDTGTLFGFFVEDNGEPMVGGIPVDELTGDTPGDDCAFDVSAGAVLMHGNITVHDGTQ